MSNLLKDLRYAIRMLIRKPGFTAVAVITLALGIGANTAIFSFVNTFLLRPLPFRQPDQLVHLWGTDRRQDEDTLRVSLANYQDWKRLNNSFSDLAAFNYTGEDLTGGQEPERISAGRVSANAFDLLGVQPLLGRGFLPGEDQPGSAQVVVLGHKFWQNRFASDSNIPGRTININDSVYTIVGVMPPDFVFPLPVTEIWIPHVLDPAKSGREVQYLQVMGRLKRGVTREQAQAEMAAIAAQLEVAYPKENEEVGINIVPLQSALNFAYDILKPMSIILFLAVGLVLLIACANVANLLLARALGRTREMAIRAALGAGRLRLVRQLLTESFLISLGGGAVGVLLAVWMAGGIERTIPLEIYRAGKISVDPPALVFTLGICLLTALIFGLAPALQSSRLNLTESLKEGSNASGTGFKRRRLQSALVVGQMALSLALLVGAGLMIRSLFELQRVDTGFGADSALTMTLVLPERKYAENEQKVAFHRRVIEEARRLPGVESAATVDYLPLNHEYAIAEFNIEGREPGSSEKALTANALSISPDYFSAMGISILNGRAFADYDDAKSQKVAIINESMASRFFPDSDSVGRSLIIKSENKQDQAATIIGVVGNTRQVELAEGFQPQIYLSQYQSPKRYFRLIIRTEGDPSTIASTARRAVWEVDGSLPIAEVKTVKAVVEEFLLPQRTLAVTMLFLAAGALILAMAGIYGVMSYFVSRRTREIGIRMALGAQSSDVIRMVMRQGLRLSIAGVAAGIAIAFLLAKVMSGMLYGVSVTDPVTFAGVSLLLAGVAMLACYIPARRATKVDPTVALRYE